MDNFQTLTNILDLAEFHRGVELELNRTASEVYTKGCCGRFAKRTRQLMDAKGAATTSYYSDTQGHITTEITDTSGETILTDIRGVLNPADFADNTPLVGMMFEWGQIHYTAGQLGLANEGGSYNPTRGRALRHEITTQNFIDDLTNDYFADWQAMLHKSGGEKRGIILPERFHVPKREILQSSRELFS
ncbi:MAG: hypothetical protein FWE38_01800 [Firmicutes bacterium]|nr:hypothetical protein [Bacillota bacterium]